MNLPQGFIYRRYVMAAVLIVSAWTMAAHAADESAVQIQVSNGAVRILSVAEAETAPPFGSDWFSETGVLISAEGHVVSNAALARRTSSVVAILTDGRRYVGTLVGSDPFSNLALFKFSALDHEPPLRAATVDLRAGDSVYAVVATADGMRQTVKARVLNAHRIFNKRDSPVLPYIEIEENNSTPIRGPIFDERGKLVGFVTLQTFPEQKTQVVLAIPSGDVRRIADQLRLSGRVRRSRIGVGIKPVPKELADERGLAEPGGALIGDVEKGGPAHRAGLMVGDIILQLDSHAIRRLDDYFVAIERIKAGTLIQIELLRGSRKRHLSFYTGEVVTGPPVGQPAPDDDRKKVPAEGEE